MTTRRRILAAFLALAVVVVVLLRSWSRPIDPRLVGRWTWSDRPGSNYPVVEFRADGVADHIAWGRGMMRTFLADVSWWREGDQIVLQYPDPPVTDLDSLVRWLKQKFNSRRQQYRFDLVEVTPDRIQWRSANEDAIVTIFDRVAEFAPPLPH